MNKVNYESTRNALEQLQQELASEDEAASDTVTDHSSSLSDRVAARKRKQKVAKVAITTTNNNNTSAECTPSMSPSPSSTTTTTHATQFSVQQSDANGLRMRISAIRPVAAASPKPTTALKRNAGSAAHHKQNQKELETRRKQKSPKTCDKLTIISNNKETVDNASYKMRLHSGKLQDANSNSQHKRSNASQHQQSPNSGSDGVVAMTTTMALSMCRGHSDLPLDLVPQVPCLSDGTESGCSSEATTTVAVAAHCDKVDKKIKIKRKKGQHKGEQSNEATKQQALRRMSFSSESEDDKPLRLMRHAQPLAAQRHQQSEQRAPRLLLTAIGGKVNASSGHNSKPSSLSAPGGSGGDHIGSLSSSDNELPDLVSAAIKRVESDTDDTADMGFRRERGAKHLPQYQSTLLQDFMEKTQMLGQISAATATKSQGSANAIAAGTATTTTPTTERGNAKQARVKAALNATVPVAAAAAVVMNVAVKKRRGRPKKIVAAPQTELTTDTVCSTTAVINESGDSGVTSTTSTMQSSCSNVAQHSARQQRSQQLATVAARDTARATPNGLSDATTTTVEISTTTKPKIDIAYLDKRIYANERVLYPPPRNKRRQSTNTATAAAAGEKKSGVTAISAVAAPRKLNHNDELLLDPVWRKIDIHKKFRRPSVCGYKSDGGNAHTGASSNAGAVPTICSKVLAAKSGYVSDYGTFHARSSGAHHHCTSGYKSDASGKSRYSTRSCASRRSRAKSCGYRSDCKDATGGAKSASSNKLRRRRRCSLLKAVRAQANHNPSDEHELLQLAGLSLGQSSEESSEYVCKPSLGNLPTTSVSKKYGEINRFVATGEYFGRGSSVSNLTLAGLQQQSQTQNDNNNSQDGTQFSGGGSKLRATPRKNLLLLATATTTTVTPQHAQALRKIKSRRSSAASYCSSYYSSTSKVKRRRRRRSLRFPFAGKAAVVDSKLLTEIEIITSTFASLCRIQHAGGGSKDGGGAKLASAIGGGGTATTSTGTGGCGKRDARDKRALKKRKISENLDFALLSAAAAASGCHTPSSGTTKRRHKKANSSSQSPDDHKLPLKKRHYLLTPGERNTEAAAAAAAIAAKLYASKAEAWAAAAALAKTTASTKAQQQFNNSRAKEASGSGGGGLLTTTPKKRHLLHDDGAVGSPFLDAVNVVASSSHSSPLRVTVAAATDGSAMMRCKLLDISPLSLSGGSSSRQSTETHSKKRLRLEGLVSKIVGHSDESKDTASPGASTATSATALATTATLTASKPSDGSGKGTTPNLDAETSCPPPGVFEPSVELEIQIPPIARLSEATATATAVAAIITKSEVASPLLNDLQSHYATVATGAHALKTECSSGRVVEALLSKTGASLLLKRKRKKINRTGFPTVRRKKRKITENLLLDVTPDIAAQVQKATQAAAAKKLQPLQARVPQAGEASDSFAARNAGGSKNNVSGATVTPRTPRLSVVALERLQSTPPNTTNDSTVATTTPTTTGADNRCQTPLPKATAGRKRQLSRKKQAEVAAAAEAQANKLNASKKGARGRKPKTLLLASPAKAEVGCTTEAAKSLKLAGGASAKQHRTAVQQIVTAQTLVRAQVKLPAGIDPNTNFSCKIRLKRRNSLYPPPPPPSKTERESPSASGEQLSEEAAAKDAVSHFAEHDVLPASEAAEAFAVQLAYAPRDHHRPDGSAATARKLVRIIRKGYLHAGLYSNYYKTEQPASGAERKLAAAANKKAEQNAGGGAVTGLSSDGSIGSAPLLVPPPYCERYYRRRECDFLLPYDIWWAHKNLKLPTRMRVPSWNYRKIRTNVYAESVRPNMAGFDHPTCNCRPASGSACGDNCLNRMVYTECSPNSCPMRDQCTNQKIQRHEVAAGVERFMTENKGWGVRTKLPIPRGTYILEYVGEVVTEREFKERMAAIYLNDTHHYCLHLDGGLVIDGHRMGSDGRFVNHSCEPNCEMQKWSVNGLSRMALFAKRSIERGEELTYDYNFSLFNPSEGQPCRCNTPHCRGVIGGKSQRVKPLPMPSNEPTSKEERRSGRQRKRKAHKNTQRLTSKDLLVTRIQQLTDKERKLVQQQGIFLLRNFEKIYKHKTQSTSSDPVKAGAGSATPTSRSGSVAAISNRRPSTPSSVVSAQISVLCAQRNVKTRGLTLAAQDPEVEKMAKIAIILRDICTTLEAQRDDNSSDSGGGDNAATLAANVDSAETSSAGGAAGINKKKKALVASAKFEPIDLKALQSNIQQGYYAQPAEFERDMQKIFADALQQHKADKRQLQKLQTLRQAYEAQKQQHYAPLLQLVGAQAALSGFPPPSTVVGTLAVQQDAPPSAQDAAKATPPVAANIEQQAAPTTVTTAMTTPIAKEKVTSCTVAAALAGKGSVRARGNPHHHSNSEDIIRCICGLYKDEGLMIQCARCMVWQHAECTKADVNADSYLCERCEARTVDYEIPLEEHTDEGYRYYLTLMRDQLHVRQGDAVYVLRDIPIKDAGGNVLPQQKHTYETIGQIDYNECDIFRVERLWKNHDGKRYIFGHHFLRPHETFHEPSRRFYPNEVVRVPLYEVVPIELVIGRCWVLDRTTFCKGRPSECADEEHCYICELRVDKSARFFSKAKVNYPTCTKSYAFRKFVDKLKISKSYAPHEVDPSLLKTKKQKTESEGNTVASVTPPVVSTPIASNAAGPLLAIKQDLRRRKQPHNHMAPPQTVKQKRTHLENILKQMKLKVKNTQLGHHQAPIDLTYLLSGRGRQRRAQTS